MEPRPQWQVSLRARALVTFIEATPEGERLTLLVEGARVRVEGVHMASLKETAQLLAEIGR